MNIIAALMGTYVLVREDDVTTKIPVVGWAHVQGAMLFPMTPRPFGGLTHGKAVETPDGFVTDPIHRKVFESSGEWEEFIDSAEASGVRIEMPTREDASPRAAVVDETAGEPAGRANAAARMPDDDDPDAVAEARRNLAKVGDTASRQPAPAPEPSNGIQFGDKSYQTKSFWKWEASQAVFIIEGNSVYPKDARVEKIKRDDYDQLKRDGWSVIDPKTGEIPGTASAEPEEETDPEIDDLV